jgi:hypothetical protein
MWLSTNKQFTEKGDWIHVESDFRICCVFRKALWRFHVKRSMFSDIGGIFHKTRFIVCPWSYSFSIPNEIFYDKNVHKRSEVLSNEHRIFTRFFLISEKSLNVQHVRMRTALIRFYNRWSKYFREENLTGFLRARWKWALKWPQDTLFNTENFFLVN